MSEMIPDWCKNESSTEFLNVERAVFGALSKRAENIVVLDLRGNSDIADFFIVMTAVTDVQVSAVSKQVMQTLLKFGEKPVHKEGEDSMNWVLIDYFDIVVHVMQPKTREYYNLEKLWGDVQKLEVSESYFENEIVRDRHPDFFKKENDDKAGN